MKGLELTGPRSWTVSGVAIRHATTLGLNLRNESGDVSDGSKEIRYRVWWALCSTERLLAVMTGRPVSFAEHNCTAPLPLPLEEDSFFLPGTQTSQALQMMRRWSSQESRQSDIAMTTTSEDSFQKKSPSSSLSPAAFSPPSQDQEQYFPPCDAMAFGYQTELSLFSNEVLNRLYRAAGMLDSWAHVQATISSLNAKLHSWRQKLPPVFDFDEKEQDQQFAFQRKSLGFSYYSMLIIINRPCLCRIDRKTPDQSDGSKISSKEAATRCVHAARGMLDLLPDEPDGIVLFQIAPWWCLVHWLMQAAVVSMLELSFRADHMPNEVEEVFDSAKKALKWLRNMSERDEAARRASTLCDDLLRHVAPKVGKSVTETPEHSNTAVEDTQNMQYKTSIDPYRGEGNPQSIQYPQVGRPPLNQFQFQSGYFTSGTFQPQFSTSYDQVLAYGQLPSTSAQAPYDEMFPTAMELDGMVLDENSSGYSWGQDQNWFPGSGI